jgi:hypothetical protein
MFEKEGVFQQNLQKTEEISSVPDGDLFKKCAVALEGVEDTTNGDADSVVGIPAACSCPKSLAFSLPRNLPMRKSALACTNAAGS